MSETFGGDGWCGGGLTNIHTDLINILKALQVLAPGAILNSNLANVLAAVPAISLTLSGGTVSGTTYSVTATFSAPCAGYIAVMGTYNTDTNTSNGSSSLFQNLVNATVVATDTIEVPVWALWGAAAVSAGVNTATMQYKPSGTLTSGYFIRGGAMFIPVP